MFFLGWHEIRQTLYESLPEGVVHFGKRFQSYSDEGDGGVTVRFKARPRPSHLICLYTLLTNDFCGVMATKFAGCICAGAESGSDHC